MKMKIDIKIEFLKITGVGDLISQKDGDENELPQQTSNMTSILLLFFHFISLSSNSTLPH
jgi:hypothetical protein